MWIRRGEDDGGLEIVIRGTRCIRRTAHDCFISFADPP